MVFVALSFIAGIGAFNFFPYFPVSIGSSCVVLITFFFFRKKTKRQYLLLLVLTFVSGFVYSSVRQNAIPEYTFPSEDLHVTGSVAGIPEHSEEEVRLTIDRVSVNGETIGGKIRFTLYQNMFKTPLSSTTLSPGDRISAIARLRKPSALRNPGIYTNDLISRGIAAVGYVKYMTLRKDVNTPVDRILRLRRRLASIIDNSLSGESGSFHKALIPGLKSGIHPAMREAFGKAGLSHLLSISGTHFGLLAFIFFQTIRKMAVCLPDKSLTKATIFITPTQAAVLCTLPFLISYACISGMSTPTVRSLIMVLIYMLALFLGRRGQWLNSLSIAGLIILIWNPAALSGLSFGLSFIAVFSIGYVLEQQSINMKNSAISPSISKGDLSLPEARHPLLQGRKGIRKLHEKLKMSLLLTTAAVLGTAPLSIAVFHQFPLIAPAANLIVTPLVCFTVLPLGFLSGFAALFLGMQTMPFSTLIESLTRVALLLVQYFSSIPYASVSAHSPPPVLIAAYYLSWMLVFKWRNRCRHVPVLLVILLYLIIPFASKPGLRITFLDVGQGDAALVEFPDNTVMLIDGGPEYGNAGQYSVAPVLWSRGIRTIDYLVISHPHPDHTGGLRSILDHFAIGEVWTTTKAMSMEKEVLYHAREKGIAVRTPVRGDFISAQGHRIFILHPYDEFNPGSPRGDFSDENSHSLVLKIETEGISILFTGDIEEEAERDLIYIGNWLKSDIIKVPHHGGRTSSTEAFLKAVNPETAVTSVGGNNPFHHPHPQTLSLYKANEIKLFRTDRDGAITITARNGHYSVTTFEDIRFQKVTILRDEIRNLRLLFL